MKLNDDIHNYYEHVVAEHIEALGLQNRYDGEFIADLCCLVLNQLPAKYIRYEVDMAFFLSKEQRLEMNQQVEAAVAKGVAFLEQRRREEDEQEKRP
ncbi:late competence development ComFB family protein [Aliidiomarina celeris]|uniref:late competence development ComFB family protein n=1 Tax=Aliidiomarina celeris TaxID=2249428 RepID=UPI000DE89E52|nr:late competence development ComFB family protein [Aliidiomarina celeris]